MSGFVVLARTELGPEGLTVWALLVPAAPGQTLRKHALERSCETAGGTGRRGGWAHSDGPQPLIPGKGLAGSPATGQDGQLIELGISGMPCPVACSLQETVGTVVGGWGWISPGIPQ